MRLGSVGAFRRSMYVRLMEYATFSSSQCTAVYLVSHTCGSKSCPIYSISGKVRYHSSRCKRPHRGEIVVLFRVSLTIYITRGLGCVAWYLSNPRDNGHVLFGICFFMYQQVVVSRDGGVMSTGIDSSSSIKGKL